MDGIDTPVTFRLCVDLNVWVNDFLATAKGLNGTVSQAVVLAVQEGRAGIGPVQLIVSHTMLSRLQGVLQRKGASAETSHRFVELIASFARLGPAPEYPRLVLGGGVQPTRDAREPVYDPYDPDFVLKPYDPEDGRVLDTALAGRADALVTANFRDFVHPSDRVIIHGRVHVRTTAAHDLYIVQPPEMAAWLRTGHPPVPVTGSVLERRRNRTRMVGAPTTDPNAEVVDDFDPIDDPRDLP